MDSSCTVRSWDGQFMSDHGMDSSCQIVRLTVREIDSSCSLRSWDGQFMYCQIMGWTVHVRSWDGQFMSDREIDSS